MSDQEKEFDFDEAQERAWQVFGPAYAEELVSRHEWAEKAKSFSFFEDDFLFDDEDRSVPLFETFETARQRTGVEWCEQGGLLHIDVYAVAAATTVDDLPDDVADGVRLLQSLKHGSLITVSVLQTLGACEYQLAKFVDYLGMRALEGVPINLEERDRAQAAGLDTWWLLNPLDIVLNPLDSDWNEEKA